MIDFEKVKRMAANGTSDITSDLITWDEVLEILKGFSTFAVGIQALIDARDEADFEAVSDTIYELEETLNELKT